MEQPPCTQNTSRKAYSTDLTDAQWQIVEPLVPAAKAGGRPANYERREILNALLYVTKNGCTWRNLPHDLPPWSLVHYYFWHWKRDGTWQTLHDRLREQLRQKLGRDPQPTAAVLDSQSVKTTEKGGRAAMTATKKSVAASAISLWTPKA
jgi:putative transposase